MNIFDVLQSICDHVKSRFPTHPIYIMQVPQGFKRPSFYVNLVGFSDRDLCKDGLRRQAVFEVVYFAQQDAKGVVNPVIQLAAYEKLMQVFQKQSLPVKDRFLKITRVDGSTRDSEVYLTISFEYTFTPETAIPVDLELMQKLNMNYQ